MVIVETALFGLLCPLWVPVFMVAISIRIVMTRSWPEPFFFPLIAAYLVIFAITFRRARIRWTEAKRAANGLCRKCGYDLRTSPDRCPECGTVPTRAGVAN